MPLHPYPRLPAPAGDQLSCVPPDSPQEIELMLDHCRQLVRTMADQLSREDCYSALCEIACLRERLLSMQRAQTLMARFLSKSTAATQVSRAGQADSVPSWSF